MKIALMLAGLSALFITSTCSISACECPKEGSPLLASWSKPRVIFVGKVTAEGAKPYSRFDVTWAHQYQATISDVIKGLVVKNSTITVFVSDYCGWDLKIGRTYLFYANRISDGAVSTNICNHTTEFGPNTKKEIALIRNPPSGQPGFVDEEKETQALYTDGLTCFDREDYKGARKRWSRAYELDPTRNDIREALLRIDKIELLDEQAKEQNARHQQ